MFSWTYRTSSIHSPDYVSIISLYFSLNNSIYQWNTIQYRWIQWLHLNWIFRGISMLIFIYTVRLQAGKKCEFYILLHLVWFADIYFPPWFDQFIQCYTITFIHVHSFHIYTVSVLMCCSLLGWSNFIVYFVPFFGINTRKDEKNNMCKIIWLSHLKCPEIEKLSK